MAKQTWDPSRPGDFASFMRAYQDMVFSTAVRILGNDAQAQDIAQEVFLKAYASFARLSGSPTPGGWLKTVTANLSINHVARYRRRWRLFVDLRRDRDGDEPETSFATPDTLLSDFDDSQRQALIEQALQKLPQQQRVPLVLYHFEEMSYEEISQRLHISLAKVKTDIRRARIALAAALTRSGIAAEHLDRDASPTCQDQACKRP